MCINNNMILTIKYSIDYNPINLEYFKMNLHIDSDTLGSWFIMSGC